MRSVRGKQLQTTSYTFPIKCIVPDPVPIPTLVQVPDLVLAPDPVPDLVPGPVLGPGPCPDLGLDPGRYASRFNSDG